LNYENLSRQELGQRLREIFETRVYRYVFVTADLGVPFGEVVDVIDTAKEEADYVAIVTPQLSKQALSRRRLDPIPDRCSQVGMLRPSADGPEAVFLKTVSWAASFDRKLRAKVRPPSCPFLRAG
jgi:hypothetical protein